MNSLNVSVVGVRGRPRKDVASAASTKPSIKYQNRFPDDGVFSGRLEGLEFEPDGGGAAGGGASEFDMVSNAAGRVGTTGIKQMLVGMYGPVRKPVNHVLSLRSHPENGLLRI